MPFEYVPLLQKQLELYQLPRGLERFQAYLKTIELAPLMAMNPMGKEHCNALLERYLDPSLDAERLAAEVLKQYTTENLFRVSLVLVDDAKGGWTNRTDYEYKLRTQLHAQLKRVPWLTILLWTSETPRTDAVVQSTQTMLRRALHVLRHGAPKTLREVLLQEAAASPALPTLELDELTYTQGVLDPLLDLSVDNMPVLVAALFGDTAAAELGYPPLGLSDNAGLALAVQSSPDGVFPARTRTPTCPC